MIAICSLLFHRDCCLINVVSRPFFVPQKTGTGGQLLCIVRSLTRVGWKIEKVLGTFWTALLFIWSFLTSCLWLFCSEFHKTGRRLGRISCYDIENKFSTGFPSNKLNPFFSFFHFTRSLNTLRFLFAFKAIASYGKNCWNEFSRLPQWLGNLSFSLVNNNMHKKSLRCKFLCLIEPSS